MKTWLQYKKEGRGTFNYSEMESVRSFLKEFKCYENYGDLRKVQFSKSCLEKLNDKVNAYNVKLAALFAGSQGKLFRKWK